MSLEGFFAGLDEGADALQAGIVNRNKIQMQKLTLLTDELNRVDKFISELGTAEYDMYQGWMPKYQNPGADILALIKQRNALQKQRRDITGIATFAPTDQPAVPSWTDPDKSGDDQKDVGDKNRREDLEKIIDESGHGPNLVEHIMRAWGEKWELEKERRFGEFTTVTDKEVVIDMIDKGIRDLRRRREDAPPLKEILKNTWDKVLPYITSFIVAASPFPSGAADPSPQSSMLGTERGVINSDRIDWAKVESDQAAFDVNERSMAHHVRNKPEDILAAMEFSGQPAGRIEEFKINHLGKRQRDHLEDYFTGVEASGIGETSPVNLTPEGRLQRAQLDLANAIKAAESGGDGYYAIALRSPDPELTGMTVGQVFKKYGDTATGAYQFKHSTIYDVLKRMAGMSEEEIDKLLYNEPGQDAIFKEALNALGLQKLIVGALGETEFKNRVKNMWRGMGVDPSRLGEVSDKEGNIIRGIIPNLRKDN